MIYHPGANPGFITYNATFPNHGLEIAILGNSDNFQPFPLFQRIFEIVERPTPRQIADQARPTPSENPQIRELSQQWLLRLQNSNIDRSQLTAEAAKELTPARARALATNANAIGKPRAFVYRGASYYSPKTFYSYKVKFSGATVFYYVILSENGKIAGLIYSAKTRR